MSNKPCAIRLVVTLNVPKHQHLTGNEKQQILVENMGSYIQLELEMYLVQMKNYFLILSYECI